MNLVESIEFGTEQIDHTIENRANRKHGFLSRWWIVGCEVGRVRGGGDYRCHVVGTALRRHKVGTVEMMRDAIERAQVVEGRDGAGIEAEGKRSDTVVDLGGNDWIIRKWQKQGLLAFI